MELLANILESAEDITAAEIAPRPNRSISKIALLTSVKYIYLIYTFDRFRQIPDFFLIKIMQISFISLSLT